MTVIWDKVALKQRQRDARLEAIAAQSDDDRELAALQLERARSDLEYGFADCPLSACRRAKRCAGNPPVCTARCELEAGAEQDLVEEFYADIQQERRNAAAEGRVPDVERVMTRRVHLEDEIEDEPPTSRAEGELEENIQIAGDALRGDDARSQPAQFRKPEPRPAPPPVAPVAVAPPEAPAAPAEPPPPAPWEPKSSPEQEERINQIWADYVAGKPMPRPGPRIRML